jgi:hypothetical protein
VTVAVPLPDGAGVKRKVPFGSMIGGAGEERRLIDADIECHVLVCFVNWSGPNVCGEIREDAWAFILRDCEVAAEPERGRIVYGIERDGERLCRAQVAAAIRCATVIVQLDRDRGHTIGLRCGCEGEGAVCGDRWRHAEESRLIRAYDEIERLRAFIVWPSMDGGGPIREGLRRRTLG